MWNLSERNRQCRLAVRERGRAAHCPRSRGGRAIGGPRSGPCGREPGGARRAPSPRACGGGVHQPLVTSCLCVFTEFPAGVFTEGLDALFSKLSKISGKVWDSREISLKGPPQLLPLLWRGGSQPCPEDARPAVATCCPSMHGCSCGFQDVTRVTSCLLKPGDPDWGGSALWFPRSHGSWVLVELYSVESIFIPCFISSSQLAVSFCQCFKLN